MKVGNPLFLIFSTTNCWKCGASEPVVALGSPRISEEIDEVDTFDSEDDGEILLLYEIEQMPPEVESFVRSQFPTLHLHFSRSAELHYFANHCKCGANFGDHYLFHADGPFAPLDQADAAKLSVREVPLTGPFDFVSGWVAGSGDLIAAFAQRI